MPLLPTDDKKRKQVPVYSGFYCYFPDAIVAVAQHSFDSNEQHNPGEPLYWNRDKSKDQLNTLARHLLELADGELSPEEELAAAKAIAWRAMANLQLTVEKQRFAVSEELELSRALWNDETKQNYLKKEREKDRPRASPTASGPSAGSLRNIPTISARWCSFRPVL